MGTKGKKVLILGNRYLTVFGFREELIERLVADGYEVLVAFPNGPASKSTGEAAAQQYGCRFIETPLNRRGANPLQELKLLVQYNSIIKKERPDVVLGYTVKCIIYGGLVCRRYKVPFIANITGLGSGFETGMGVGRIVKSLCRVALRQAECIFFQNQQDMAYFEKERIKGKRSALLPGSGVNLEKFAVQPWPQGDKTVFTYTSRVMQAKGIDQFLDMARALHGPAAEFHICGPCEEDYTQILAQEQKNGTVVYHGWTPDVREYLKASHCIVAPSFYPEGISNVLLEAAACGRPIITTDHAGCRETVDDGVTGFLVKEKDSADLIEKTKRFLALTRAEQQAMGLAGRRKVEKEFDRQIVVEAYMELINDLPAGAQG